MEETLKYPIGQFAPPGHYPPTVLNNYISDIKNLPQQLKQEVRHLSQDQLDTAYRPGGWTVRQVVNHLADSHMNGLIRVKMALTEEMPVIKPYHQEYWAELADGKHMAIEAALQTLEGVHERWAALLTSLGDKEWQRGYIHPEKGREVLLTESAGSYAWHGRHHLAHITSLKQRNNWP